MSREVCVYLLCVCVRAYACITGFSWLSQNGIPVADTPKPEVWRLFQYVALSLSFDHSSAASTFQTIFAIYVATFFFIVFDYGCQRSFNPRRLLMFNSLKRKQIY